MTSLSLDIFVLIAVLLGAVVARIWRHAVAIIHDTMDLDPEDTWIFENRWHCEECDKKRRVSGALPIFGWILTRDRYKSCRHPVPWLYPVVEAGVAAASGVIAYIYGPDPDTMIVTVVFWVLVGLSWMDLEKTVLPEILTVPLLFAGLAFSPLESDAQMRIYGMGAAGGIVWASFLLTSCFRSESFVAGGDVVLAAAAGAWLGIDVVFQFLIGMLAIQFLLGILLRLWKVYAAPAGPAISIAFMGAVFLAL